MRHCRRTGGSDLFAELMRALRFRDQEHGVVSGRQRAEHHPVGDRCVMLAAGAEEITILPVDLGPYGDLCAALGGGGLKVSRVATGEIIAVPERKTGLGVFLRAVQNITRDVERHFIFDNGKLHSADIGRRGDAQLLADVAASAWYAGFVDTAYSYGIVNGRSATSFDPSGNITRQEAATMVARAAKHCGMDTDYSTVAAWDVLSQFGDYTKVADWAKAPLAFCYDRGILDDSVLNIWPTQQIKRCEIAQMLYNMLEKANLL